MFKLGKFEMNKKNATLGCYEKPSLAPCSTQMLQSFKNLIKKKFPRWVNA